MEYEKRKYQETAIAEVHVSIAAGKRAPCLVMPIGSGKTYVAARIASSGRILWVAPSQELVQQAAEVTVGMYGIDAVSVMMPGGHYRPHARIQVATVGTLLARGLPENVDKLILDECHHMPADVWRSIPDEYKSCSRIGLTATPERSDGKPLGDIFDHLIVGARRQDLVEQGILVPWVIYQSERHMGHDYAVDPLAAWRELTKLLPDPRTFAYFRDVSEAEAWARAFEQAGIPSACISCMTPDGDRTQILDGLRRRNDCRQIDVVTNVGTMGEGVDVPPVSCVILASQFRFGGRYVQACGRAGRCSPGKEFALLIDPIGSSRRHGNPNDDWEYSLEGRDGMRRIQIVNGPKGGNGPRERSTPVTADNALILSDATDYTGAGAEKFVRRYLAQPNAQRLAKAQSRIAHTLAGGMAE
jgi:superfamily II DNA or RNA helicase